MDIVTFRYVNHKGREAQRRVRPIRLWFGSTAWHPESCLLLEACDIDKNATRDFSMQNITDWRKA
jgi:predicted DNA-binding transcriptional regulator YafY